MIYSLKLIFVIYALISSFVVQSIVTENDLKYNAQIMENALELPGVGSSLLKPKSSTPSVKNQLQPLFPTFGSLVAPRIPEDKDPMGHGPLSDYSVKYLQKLTLDEARQLKDKLVREQWSKNQSHEENVRFMYLLDEAFYDVGIALDFIVQDIMHKIDHLSHHHIKALAVPDLFTIKKSAKDASEQILRRYLTLSELHFLKRYIDSAIKSVLEVDKPAH